MKKISLILLYFIFCHSSFYSQTSNRTKNIILITYDGLRWQEVFKGIEKRLLQKSSIYNVEEKSNSNYERSRQLLMPFMWNTIAQNGQIYGNRDFQNKVNLSNNFWFSYPGYNEILTGLKNDLSVFSNLKTYNPNVTVLEHLNNTDQFHNKVVAFGSWELFPYIFNDHRCGFYVNAGNKPTLHDSLDKAEMELTKLLTHTHSPWESVRPDSFTKRYAIDYLKKYSPKLMFISFGETDEYAHEGNYNEYLNAINKTDSYIEEIWNYVQSNDNYRNQTTLFITTDHGRGYLFEKSWKKHGRNVMGSGQSWFAVIGPDTNALGEIKSSEQLYSNQLAQTITTLLDVDYKIHRNCGNAIEQVVVKKHEIMAIKTDF